MVTVLPDWWNIGDLGRLVEPETASVVLREAGLDVASVAPDYLKVKGDEAALVGFSMQTESSHGDAVTIPGYARTFASRERAAEVFAKALRKKVVVTAGGPGVSMTADGRTVIFLFPNDGELDGLRRIAEWSSCRRALTELPAFAGYRIRKSAGTLTPVRYKPERRLVARLGLVLEDSRSGDLASIDAYLRWFRDGRGVALAAIAADLAAAGVPVPAPIGVGVGGRLVVEHAAIGSSATTAIRRGELDVGAVVDAVVRMKGVPVTPDAVGDRRTAARTVAGAIASLDTLAAFDGGLAGSACQIAVALRSTRLDEEPVGVVHGDLHLDQIVVDGNAIALVDLERFGVGSPSLDAAMLSAHIIELAVRDRSASGHLAVTAEDVRREWSRRTATSDRQFSVYVACALVERALLAFRRLEAGRVATALGLLEAAQATLPGPTLEVVYPRPAGSWGGRGVDDNGTTVFAVLGGDIEWREPGTDPDLPGLAPLLDRGELLSYRPGRRAVVAVDEGAVFAKVLRPRRAEACAERFRVARQLSEATVGAPRVPAVLPPLVEGPGVVFLQGLPGRPLHTWLTDTVEEAGRRRAIARAAGILEQFQALPVDAVDLPGAAEGGDPSDWVEVVAAAQPGWRAPYADVAARFADAPASMRVALVHGDLHDRNLLLDGGVGGILDLDALGVGDPAIDTGNLVAHLYLRALQRGDGPAVGTEDVATLLGAHRGESEAVGYWSARSLFRLACIYRFRRRWAHLAPQLLRDSAAWMTTGPGPDPAARSASGP